MLLSRYLVLSLHIHMMIRCKHIKRFKSNFTKREMTENKMLCNKANLRDLIAATGLLLKLDINRSFVSLCDHEIWRMTSKNNRAPLLYYVKLCASFQIHQWINSNWSFSPETLNSVKIGNFLSRVTLKFNGWQWKSVGNLFYFTSNVVQTCASAMFSPRDLEIWRTTLKINMTPLLCYFKLCASFHSHQWIQTGVTVRKHQIWVKIDDSFVSRDL